MPPLCHQSSPPVIAPHSLLPPCQFSAPHLASVARAENVVGLEWWPVQLSSTCPLSCRKPGHTLLAPLSTQPPASLPLPPLPLARNIKVSGQLPHASGPTSISTGSSQPAIGYLATVSSFPSCIVIPAAALIPQPAHSQKPPITRSLSTDNQHLLGNIRTGQHLFASSNKSQLTLSSTVLVALLVPFPAFMDLLCNFEIEMEDILTNAKPIQSHHCCSAQTSLVKTVKTLRRCYHLITAFFSFFSPPLP